MALNDENKNAITVLTQAKNKLDGTFRNAPGAGADDPSARKWFLQLRDDLNEMLQRIPSEAQQTNLEGFFDDVSSSLVAAQQALDEKSKLYIQEAAKNSHIQPSVFRIPKASAKFQFAMEKGTSRGFNLFVFSSETSENTRMQHSVSFDVVASPPPVDLLSRQQQGGDIPAADHRVAVRRMLKEILEGVTQSTTPKWRLVRDQLVADIFSAQVLTDGQRHLILTKGQIDGNEKLLVAMIAAPDAEGECVVTFKSPAVPTETQAFGLIVDMLLTAV